MPVLFDSSTWNAVAVNAASGSVSAQHVANANAKNLFAIVGGFWLSSSDNTTAGTMTATFGGEAMTPQTPIYWGANGAAEHVMMQAFTLPLPPSGQQTVEIAASSMGGVGDLMLLSGTWSGVAQADAAVVVDGTALAATNQNSVTIPSVAPAYTTVGLHGTGTTGVPMTLGAYAGGTIRQKGTITLWPYVDAAMILGDAPGAADVTLTATQGGNTINWGAYGFNLWPAPVFGDATTSITMSMNSGGSIYRVGNPAPERFWPVLV